MRARIFLLLCALAFSARAEQLFIPLDEHGNPIRSETDASGEPVAEPDEGAGDESAARLAREALEAEYRKQVESRTVAYVGCLASEAGRTFGPEYSNCEAERTQLRGVYAADIAELVLGCLEIAVLDEALSGDRLCGFVVAPPRDTSNARRWP